MRLEGSAFFRTDNLLRARPFRRWLLLAAVCFLIWGGWFFLAPLPITAISTTATFSSPEAIMAQFTPDTALLLTTNQPAEIRVDQFPWREFGAGQGVVVRNNGQIRADGVEVEILYRGGLDGLPLQRGLTAEIVVTTAEKSPAALLWDRLVARTAGD